MHLHSLSLDTWRLRWLTEPTAPVAILEHGAVFAQTPAARRLGITLGMRRATASGLAPDCLFMARDIVAEQAAFAQAAQIALRYTPSVAQHLQHTLLLEVSASLQLFGGLRTLLRLIRHDLQRLQYHARASVAPTATGAWLLAQADPDHGHAANHSNQSNHSNHSSHSSPTVPTSPYWPRYTCKLSSLARALDRMPCARLPAAQPYLAWFNTLGCHTLGALRALPRAGLQRRSGVSLLAGLDDAYNGQSFHYTPYLAPARYAQHQDLLDRVENVTALLAIAQRLLNGLCIWLAAQQQAAREIDFEFHHERGRHACSPTVLSMALAEPAWALQHFMRPLTERMARHTLAGAVVAVTLRSLTLAERPAFSGTLFPDPGHAPADYRRLLDLLAARLGSEQILHPAPIADHRPEVANTWGTHGTHGTTAATPAASPARLTAAERPFWLLPQPLLLSMREDRPVLSTPLQLLRGPERIECGWWDAPLTVRDYFVAQDTQAVRYWVYRERDAQPVRWFLHGVFS